MRKFVIVVHGGAGSLSPYLKQHELEQKEGLKEALCAGHQLLKQGKSALAAVEKAVIKLEDNPLFNAGRGSVLNANGEVEMDASIMDGSDLKAGAVCMVRNVKNPIVLARNIMLKTKHVLLSGYGALELAKFHDITLEPDAYFITDHQFEAFQKASRRIHKSTKAKKTSGTVGAVAIDKNGNLAAATSTGGTSYSLPGRIGDSCIIGAGCYANNKTCAVSGTGEGEFLITGVVAHTISMLVELKGYTIQKACHQVIHKRVRLPKKDMGVISLDKKGNIGIAFNTQSMPRGYIDHEGNLIVHINN